MASHIVQHADRKPYRRDFLTGRTPKPDEMKFEHQVISLPPQLKRQAAKWKQKTGKSFSAWVQDRMREAIYIETV